MQLSVFVVLAFVSAVVIDAQTITFSPTALVCEWSTGTNKCDVSMTALLQAANTPAARVALTSATCEKLATSSACGASSDCEWDSSSSKCSSSSESAVRDFLGTANPLMVFVNATACAGLYDESSGKGCTSSTCSGDARCECSPSDECQLKSTPALANLASDAKFLTAVSTAVTCSGKTTSAACGAASSCQWSDSACSISTAAVTSFVSGYQTSSQSEMTTAMSTCAALSSESGCNAKSGCRYSAEDKECGMSGDVMMRFTLGLKASDKRVTDLAAAATLCNKYTSQADCSADSANCQWEKGECDPSDKKSAYALGMSGVYDVCSAKTTQDTCAAVKGADIAPAAQSLNGGGRVSPAAAVAFTTLAAAVFAALA